MFWLFYFLLSQLFYTLFPFDCCFLYGAQIRWDFISQPWPPGQKNNLGLRLLIRVILESPPEISWRPRVCHMNRTWCFICMDDFIRIISNIWPHKFTKVELQTESHTFVRTPVIYWDTICRTDTIWVHVRDNNWIDRETSEETRNVLKFILE